MVRFQQLLELRFTHDGLENPPDSVVAIELGSIGHPRLAQVQQPDQGVRMVLGLIRNLTRFVLTAQFRQ